MNTRVRRPDEKGQTLVLALMLVLIALIMVPYLVTKVQNEGKWSVKEMSTTKAYHLAEAGQDRAIWDLVSSTMAWYNELAGAQVAGYSGEVVYTDVSGGTYNINISSGPGPSQVTVFTKGHDTTSNQSRGIKAVYSGIAFQSGLISSGLFNLNPDFYVYWGQITSYSGITQTTAGGGNYTAFTGCNSAGTATGGVGSPTIPYYPYKDAAGQVSPWKTANGPPLCDATKNYCAFDKNLPTIPVLNFNYYRALAQNSTIPIPYDNAGHVSDGGRSAIYALNPQTNGPTGYFNGAGVGGYPVASGGSNCNNSGGNDLYWGNYFVNCATCAIFFENDNLTVCDGPGSIIVGAMVLFSGNLHLHSNGWYAYPLQPPSNAWQQYTAGTYVNPTGPGEGGAYSGTQRYPGDGGHETLLANYIVPNSSNPPKNYYDINGGAHAWPGYAAFSDVSARPSRPFDQCKNTGLSFRGFLYVNGFNCALGYNAISGQVLVGPNGTNIGNGGDTHVIYFDQGIGAGVRYLYPPLSRISWNEVSTSFP